MPPTVAELIKGDRKKEVKGNKRLDWTEDQAARKCNAIIVIVRGGSKQV